MAHEGSRKAVLVALAANALIAAAKLAAALVTSSGSMLAEAIHSFADCGNQGLLMLGAARAARPADAQHPLGYGREAFFWALMVAVVLFTLGGVFSVQEGIQKFRSPHPVEHAGWAIGVLVIAILLEGWSLRTALAAAREARAGEGLFAWAKRTADVDLLVVTFEDIAALSGLGFALVAVTLATLTGDSRYDAAGSLVVGLVLLFVAVFVGAQMRRLLVGDAPDEPTQADLRRVWNEHGFDVLHAIVVWCGPRRLMIAVKICPRERDITASLLMERMNAGEQAVRAALPALQWQFTEPDVAD